MEERALREAICAAGRRLESLGLVVAAEGNLSARLDADLILSTPRGVRKGELTPDDLVVCQIRGGAACMAASTEILIHLITYEMVPVCGAIVHAHPPYATAYACSRLPFPGDVTAESVAILGHVPTLAFAMPGTAEVAAGIAKVLPDVHSMLLSHHGAVCWGADLETAMRRMETLERTAQIAWLTQALGGSVPMPADALDELRRKR